MQNRQVRLKSRPTGAPQKAHFDIVDVPCSGVEPGQVLGENLLLSVDPYMRSRMNEGRSYLPPIPLGGVMGSSNVARVVMTANPAFEVGDLVTGYGGWEKYSVYSVPSLRKIDASLASPEAFLGVLGMPGSTAYVGVCDFADLKAGETFVVSAASGPVGSVAGQIAKIRGARVVGIAGGPEKCQYVVEELGFDACVDHRDPNFRDALSNVCPVGIDVDFENVGGAVLQAIWPLLNDHARIPLCGLIADYNNSDPLPGPDLRNVLSRRIKLLGFNIVDHRDRTPAFLRDASMWLKEGRIKHREHVVEGLESAPDALISLLDGRTFGKVIVRV